MGFTYAIADLHGRVDLLTAALGAIANYATGPHTIICLGDYVDRGPHSRHIIEHLIAGSKVPGQALICLKGNHEAMMVQCCREPGKLSWWLGNGGGTTLMSYGQAPGEVADPSVVPEGHLAWLTALPLMHVDAHRIYVHAGVDPLRPLETQGEDELLWRRYAPGDEVGHGTRHVVHGHDPFEAGPLRLAGRTDLDTLAWATGRLVVGVFDDAAPGGPVDLIEVIGTKSR
jgi:serine/threonine protein phosphatase 1